MLVRELDKSVFLHMLEKRHANDLFNVIEENRTHLRKFLPWVDDTKSYRDTESFIQKTLSEYASFKGHTYGIWCGNKLVGVVRLTVANRDNKSASMGYWLAQGYQGKGIITKACKNLIDFGFATFNYNKIIIQCITKNDKSKAIPHRLGFLLEGTLRDHYKLYGEFHDMEVYGMLKRDWVKTTHDREARSGVSR